MNGSQPGGRDPGRITLQHPAAPRPAPGPPSECPKGCLVTQGLCLRLRVTSSADRGRSAVTVRFTDLLKSHAHFPESAIRPEWCRMWCLGNCVWWPLSPPFFCLCLSVFINSTLLSTLQSSFPQNHLKLPYLGLCKKLKSHHTVRIGFQPSRGSAIGIRVPARSLHNHTLTPRLQPDTAPYTFTCRVPSLRTHTRGEK